jgi:molybdopterin synthase catalytic subunit
MHVLAVRGAPDERTAVAEALVERLEQEGTVATVTRPDAEPVLEGREGDRYGSHSSGRHYRLGEEAWTATGDARTLDGVLDEAAPRSDYAVVEGFEETTLPTVVVGNQEVTGERVLDRIPSSEKLDVDALVAELEATDPYETLESLIARVKRSPDSERAGAIATFTGRVRAKEHDDDAPTEYLEFERYDEVATERMTDIREELEARDGVYEVLMHHRTGVVKAEEDIVFVVVLAGHRPEAFATVEDGIDRLKDKVPLFKKEVTVEGTFWAHQHDPSTVESRDADLPDQD